MPPPPDAARSLFGSRLPLALAYAELLAGPGVERGLIGPAEPGRIWDRHLLNSAAIAELVPAAGVPVAGVPTVGQIADLGSGAGLPGIVLAIVLPAVQVILVEPMERRTAFLTECVNELELVNAVVLRGRAEDLAGQIQADVVTSRAVASLDRLAVLAAGLARPGGLVLAIKGASAAQEVERAGPVLRRIGATGVEIVTAGAGILRPPATVVRFTTSELAVTGRRPPGTARVRRG